MAFQTSFGALLSLIVHKTVREKIPNPAIKAMPIQGLMNKPKMANTPASATAIKSGGETVTKPNKNWFQLKLKIPLLKMPVEFGRFWKYENSQRLL